MEQQQKTKNKKKLNHHGKNANINEKYNINSMTQDANKIPTAKNTILTTTGLKKHT